MGTEQVEQEMAALFPGARIMRMDRDTTSGRTDHERIYDKVKAHEVDILIGTQMLAKGLDFPNVTVVGVLQAEQELAFPSWRSSERLFQLLSQVSGRAGRAHRKGQVFIQTWKPDHAAILAAQGHDYPAFEAAERIERRSASYPPYSRIVQFHMKGASRDHVIAVSRLVGDVLRERTSPEAVLGPSPAVIERVQRKTHWLATLKVDPRVPAGRMSAMITGILDEVERRLPEGGTSVRISVDVDAVE
jgi:primosomal protein N' (replication factor Y)